MSAEEASKRAERKSAGGSARERESCIQRQRGRDSRGVKLDVVDSNDV